MAQRAHYGCVGQEVFIPFSDCRRNASPGPLFLRASILLFDRAAGHSSAPTAALLAIARSGGQ